MPLCPNCSFDNHPQARFCSNCGIRLIPLSKQLPVNTAIDKGRYIITSILSAGGMGNVYKALDARLDNKAFVIKEMIDRFTDQQERDYAIKRFREETRLLSILRHPHLPIVHDYFIEAGRYYLVMDYVEGKDLEKIVAGYPRGLPEKRVVAWALQLCSVLSYLHNFEHPDNRHPQIIIYRDIKPSNIVINSADKAILVDFGIAKVFDPKVKGTMIGTPGYAPPEQYQGMAEPRSDVYSLGATMHHLLTGQDPRQRTPFSFPPVRSMNPNVSPRLSQIVAKALSLKAEKRYRTVDEMRMELEGGVIQPSISTATSGRIPPPDMIHIPAGEFIRGSDDSPDERPKKKIYLDDFYIDEHPVTNREYTEFIRDTKHKYPEGWIKGTYPSGKDDHPVVGVSWEDAKAYAEWAGKRLPTEAEWEKAARGSDGRRYPWGDNFDKDRCNTLPAGIGDTTSVGRHSPEGDSPYGVTDMAGNIWEWVADWYDENYYRLAPDRNPLSPRDGRYKVARGGSYLDAGSYARITYRYRYSPSTRLDILGFRCAWS